MNKTMMMKQLIKLLTLLFLPFFSMAQEDKMNDLEKSGINGPVKYYIEYAPLEADCYENLENGQRKSKFYCSANKSERTEYTFNKNGGLIKKEGYEQTDADYNDKTKRLKTFTTTYDGFGKKNTNIKYDYGLVESKSSFKYDNNGNLIEESVFEYKNEVAEKFIYKYDDNENLLEELHYKYSDPGEIWRSFEWFYKYNEDGDLIEETEYVNGEFESKIEYTTNIYNYTTLKAYDSEGELTGTGFISKDDDGKVLSQKLKNSEDKIRFKTDFEYSDFGMLKEKITSTFNEDEELSIKETEKYNEVGDLIESSTYWYTDKSEIKYLYKYNEDDYLIEIITVKNGMTTDKDEYKYFFDEHDNLIREIEYLNGRAVQVTEIEIKYF